MELFSRAQVCFLATGTIFILFFPLFECILILFYASDKSLCCAFISDVADKKAVFENTNEQATKYVAEDNEETRREEHFSCNMSGFGQLGKHISHLGGLTGHCLSEGID